MLKIMMSLASLFVSATVFAAPTLSESMMQIQVDAFKASTARAIDWKPGDSANYNVDMGIVQGTMVMTVDSNDGNEIWLSQNMDLGFAGKQQVQTLMDANTGAVKQVLVNGQEQEIPKQDLEVVEIVDDTITVPAGTFKCLHARLTDKSTNDEINLWNNSEVPMSGMVKTTQPSQFGMVTVELTGFNKQ
jgi:hypothetical protein